MCGRVEAAPYSNTERDLAVAKPRLLSPAKSRLKGGCSQDWLPHIFKPQNPENV
jgi:hypothetical protein